MRRWLTPLLALVFLAAPVAAQTKNALDVVPEDALGFIVVHDLRQFSDKVAELAKKVNAPAHISLLELIQRQGLGKGLDEKGSALFILLKGADEKSHPVACFAVPVKDHQLMRQELGVKGAEEIAEGEIRSPSDLLAGLSDKEIPEKEMPKVKMLVAKRDNFALLAAPECREGLVQVLASKKSITAGVQQASKWLAEQDIAGVCTDHGVKFGLAMALSTPAGGAAGSTPEQVAQMKAMFAEVEKNVKLVAFGAGFDKEGNSRLQSRIYVDPSGSYAQWLSKTDVLEGKLLSWLPEERCWIAAMARISPQMNCERLVEMTFARDLPADKAKQITADTVRLLKRVSELSVGSYLAPANGKGLPTPLDVSGDTAFIAKVDNAESMIKDIVSVFDNRVQAASSTEKPKVEIKKEQRDIGQRQAHLITLTEPAKDKQEQAKTTRIVLTALDAQTVLAGCLHDGSEPEAFIKHFGQQPDKSLATSPPLRKTATVLGARQAALYLNLQAMSAAANLGFRLRPDCPPVGFGVSAMPDSIEARFVVPFDTLQAVFAALHDQKKSKEGEK